MQGQGAETDEKGRIKLSMKALLERPEAGRRAREGASERARPRPSAATATVAIRAAASVTRPRRPKGPHRGAGGGRRAKGPPAARQHDPKRSRARGKRCGSDEITQPGGPRCCANAAAGPRPAAGELLIAVHRAGVNRPDVLQRKGLYPMPPGVSDLPGWKSPARWPRRAGRPAAAGLKIGDPVCALVAGGGYAELCVAGRPVPAGAARA